MIPVICAIALAFLGAFYDRMWNGPREETNEGYLVAVLFAAPFIPLQTFGQISRLERQQRVVHSQVASKLQEIQEFLQNHAQKLPEVQQTLSLSIDKQTQARQLLNPDTIPIPNVLATGALTKCLQDLNEVNQQFLLLQQLARAE